MTPNEFTYPIVKDSVVYHIQKDTTQPGWNVGDSFFFGEVKNHFFSSFDDASTVVTVGGVNYYVRDVLLNLNRIRKGEDSFIPSLGECKIDYAKVEDVAYKALSFTTSFIRETIFEEVRLKFFPHLPSRQRCIWVIPDGQSLTFWKQYITGRIFQLKINGKAYRASDKHLGNDSMSINQYRRNAFNYWAGLGVRGDPDEEILFEGFVEVIEEVKVAVPVKPSA
jgi:hypothetical protein